MGIRNIAYGVVLLLLSLFLKEYSPDSSVGICWQEVSCHGTQALSSRVNVVRGEGEQSAPVSVLQKRICSIDVSLKEKRHDSNCWHSGNQQYISVLLSVIAVRRSQVVAGFPQFSSRLLFPKHWFW